MSTNPTRLLKKVVDEYMQRVPGIDVITNRCLSSQRWGGSIVLMVIDAAFTSIGLNYFTAVVPKVEEFRKRFVATGKIAKLAQLAETDQDHLLAIWRNRRSWSMAKGVASCLSEKTPQDDREALRGWARDASLAYWDYDPIGTINGVGLVTFQYLRMMGGIDTVMPDKIVKRVINDILVRSGLKPVLDDMKFVGISEQVAKDCGYRPIELCWMTWMVQPEGHRMRMAKYAGLLKKI